MRTTDAPLSGSSILGRLLAVLLLASFLALSPRPAVATEPDDDIPGVPIGASPFESGVGQYADPHDVFSIYLSKDQTLTVSVLTLTTGLDLDIYLYRPHAFSVDQASAIVASANRGAVPETFTYTAPEWGTHYLNVRAWHGTGAYRVTYTVDGEQVPEPDGYPEPAEPNDQIPGSALGPSPQLGTMTNTWADPRDVFSLPLGKGQTFHATMTWNHPDMNLNLSLWNASGDAVATSWATQPGADTVEELTYVATGTGTYYLVPWLMSNYGDEYLLTFETTGVPPKTAPVVGAPVAPPSVKHAAMFRVTGELSPAHVKGTVVKILTYRKTTSGYASKGSVNAVVQASGDYLVRMSLPKAGTWRLRAVHVADYEHVTARSPYTTVRVR
jgi:hypothetical protein